MRTTPPARRLRVHGLLGVIALVAVIALGVASYQQAFTPAVTVSLQSDRAGLLMDPGADVRLRGIKIGQVRSVEPGPDGGAVMALALDPDYAARVPADVTAELLPSTIFGAKTVNLIVADGPVAQPIAEGGRIRVEHITTEINDVFAGLQDVLVAVKPSRLNATLGAMAQALDGRGSQLGEYVSELNSYLGRLNPHLPQLRTVNRTGAEVADNYARVAPDVVEVARNFTKTSRTLTEVEATLHAFLVDASSSSRRGTRFLDAVGPPLITSMDVLNPTMRLMHRYSPMLTCTFQGLNEARRRMNGAIANQLPGIQARTSFLPGQEGYKYPRDLPKFVTGNGPHCYELPYVSDKEIPIPRYTFDDGSHVFEGDGGIKPGDPPVEVFEQLLGPIPPEMRPR